MRWVSSFCRNDTEHVNMVLKPTGPTGEPGSRLYLYASINEPGPIAQWDLPVPIKATVPCNPAYRRIINSIVKDYGIDVIFVSTLIGHSMDVLKTKATTVLVCHDHFPLTPEIHIGACDLSGNRITDFSVDKVFDRGSISPFTNYSRSEAKVAHKAFSEILARRIIKLVTPSPSARRIYLDLAPKLDSRDITVIPNGTAESILSAPLVPYESNGKLRIVIPGRLSVAKGRALLEAVILKLADMADIFLVGCGLEGVYFADIPGVQAINEYEHDELPELLEEFKPHIGLLLSNVPETFSYTLDELLSLGIPPVVMRIGNLADRITDGLNGFLVDNSPDAVLDKLKTLDEDRTQLEAVRKTLEVPKHRTEARMVRDYELLLGFPRYSEHAINAKPLPLSAYRRIPRSMSVTKTEPLFPAEAFESAHFNAERSFDHQSTDNREKRNRDARLIAGVSPPGQEGICLGTPDPVAAGGGGPINEPALNALGGSAAKRGDNTHHKRGSAVKLLVQFSIARAQSFREKNGRWPGVKDLPGAIRRTLRAWNQSKPRSN